MEERRGRHRQRGKWRPATTGTPRCTPRGTGLLPVHTTDHPADNDLAGRLSDLARTLQDEHNVDGTLQAIVQGAVGTVPGAQYAASSVVERRDLHPGGTA